MLYVLYSLHVSNYVRYVFVCCVRCTSFVACGVRIIKYVEIFCCVFCTYMSDVSCAVIYICILCSCVMLSILVRYALCAEHGCCVFVLCLLYVWCALVIAEHIIRTCSCIEYAVQRTFCTCTYVVFLCCAFFVFI